MTLSISNPGILNLFTSWNLRVKSVLPSSEGTVINPELDEELDIVDNAIRAT
jgi:hypothetical protein